MVVAYKTTLINIAVEVTKTKATMIHQMAVDIEDMEKEIAAIGFITELQITHNDEDIRKTDILDSEMMTGYGKEIKKNINIMYLKKMKNHLLKLLYLILCKLVGGIMLLLV